MTGRQRQPLVWAAVALLVVVAVALVGVYWYINHGPGQASPPGSVVAELSGNGNQVTAEFDVRSGWRLDWQNQGDQFSFAIRGDRDFGTVVDQQEPGNGSTFPTGGGRYRLEVTANGPWSVTILQGD